MARIIRVDFTARTVTEARPDEATDDVSDAIAELLRGEEADRRSARPRAPEPRDAETRCPVCRSATCSLWRELRGPTLTVVR